MIAEKTSNKELFFKALNIAETIKNLKQKINSIIAIANKCQDRKLMFRILELTNTFDDINLKQKILTNLEIGNDIEILNRILEMTNTLNCGNVKLKILASIIDNVKDERLLKRVLEITNILKNSKQKIEILIMIAKITNDLHLYNRAYNLIDTVENPKERIKLVQILVRYITDYELIKLIVEKYGIFAKNQLYKLFQENIIFNLSENINFVVKDTYLYVSSYDENSILNYYGIENNINTVTNSFSKIVIDLVNLKSDRTEAEVNENEKLYDEITERAEVIKKDLIDNKNNLEEFLSEYNISMLKLKKSDILDIV